MGKTLAINAGSSTLKWKLFAMPEETVIASGMVDRLNLPGSIFKVKLADGQKFTETQDKITNKLAAAMVLTRLKSYGIVQHLSEITGVGHRVVAGGEVFKDSAVITPTVLKQIKELKDYAPLHNPVQAYYIDVFQQLLPEAQQVAVFDTSLYTQMPAMNYLYSLPYAYYEKFGARKYGAHGTSHRYVAKRTAELLGQPLEALKLITLHLGSGSSITAFDHGQALDTSMGFTPLAGVMMGTRSGDVDPSLVAYLAEKLQKTMPEMIDILNHQSGLLGISELSPDQRDLEDTQADRPKSKLALDMFVNRVVRYVGSYVAELGGVDAIAFTAGSGENGIAMRQDIADQLAGLNIAIDPAKNDFRGEERVISPDGAAVKVLVVPTNEELMIVRDVARLTH
ncbi:acetate kinase [Levilactobacillus brevis]|jgi:acetate kinase|uniref:Acetate kinase n=1 Tax=Levilactobacillus brevis (strain ATCC 367 / BCRC 12310 / CIP 105137 / JCM 1170 / LMG 11437 / NCIMB 947 / NCTC 947) TaxID=387344 RepID=Q03U23_LEVBA|nr:acetate kinase [Levilactobacillus brevis]ABJ63299.1 Acetate kinase [Levilactobacillus brevis ATCC 367]KWT47770.1 acetate kinase [Levilactobacillus brevis]KWU30517.1 acetate kinase [Levilactobacillus brevis]MBU7538497.1 acetate kinase [Levilactobacillus brevis]MBU7564728.1 acetate kinase [Levilactobacillus brevis]